MSIVAVLGEPARVDGFALAGARTLPASDAAAVRAAWATLDDDVGLLVVTPMAAATIAGELAERRNLLWVVMP